MRKIVTLFVLLALFASIGLAATEKPRAEKVVKKKVGTVLMGEYKWGDRATGDLEAVFVPTGKKSWDVDFHFEFRGEPHVYSGTATGLLSAGQLKGVVFNEEKDRSFTFSGDFSKDGVLTGVHAETTEGRKRDTGTLTLRAKGKPQATSGPTSRSTSGPTSAPTSRPASY